MKIGVIIATESEIRELLESNEIFRVHKISGIDFFEIRFDKIDLFIAKSGIGKVASALATDILIHYFHIESIINIGLSGSLSENIKPFDIVFAKNALQYDFDTSALGDKPGFISGINMIYFECADIEDKIENLKFEYQKNILDAEFLRGIRPDVRENIFGSNFLFGTVATGDTFITDKERKKQINEIFGAVCCDMELAAIAQTCYLNQKNVLSAKIISDDAESDSKTQYLRFEKYAAHLLNALAKSIFSMI